MAGEQPESPRCITAVALAAAAGGLGWGIRGQYGHETGAMIAGVLVGFVLIRLFAPEFSSLRAARAVALLTLGVAIGGSMTYGQTIGLTQNAQLIGNWAALRWGLLGLFIKGGVWIGFAGALLGVGLSRKRYRISEMALVLVALLGLQLLGMWLWNSPFDPDRRLLPRIYFSADWYWDPTGDLKPRPECWGGLLLALVGLTGYLYGVRRDRLAGHLAVSGFFAGAVGFSAGQCVQAFHAWNPQLFQAGWLGRLDPHMNWWNMMEISFGAIWSGLLAASLWFHRRQLVVDQDDSVSDVSLTPGWELALAALFAMLVLGGEFSSIPVLELFLEFGLVIVLVPLIGILGGRYWPYLFPLPMVALPIAGKTLRELSYKSTDISRPWGWVLLVVVPLVVSGGVAVWFARRDQAGRSALLFARIGLLTTTWLYFGLNLCFFRFPWPWQAWTGRTPSGIIFAVCVLVLTAAAIWPVSARCGAFRRNAS